MGRRRPRQGRLARGPRHLLREAPVVLKQQSVSVPKEMSGCGSMSTKQCPVSAGKPLLCTKLTASSWGSSDKVTPVVPSKRRWKAPFDGAGSTTKAATPAVAWWENVSSPKTRSSRGRGGRARYEPVLKRIQLSRPSKTARCMADGGTKHAHTAREHVDSFSWKN